MLMVLYMLRG